MVELRSEDAQELTKYRKVGEALLREDIACAKVMWQGKKQLMKKL